MADGWCYGIPSREEVQGKIKYLKRPSWCPLRPMPKKMKRRATDGAIDLIYATGYNKCLEEITGETE